MNHGLVERITAGGGSEAGRDMHRAGMAGVHRGDQVHDLLPVRADALEINARTTDLLDARGDLSATWQKPNAVVCRPSGGRGGHFLTGLPKQ
jgi:hypothetical protein